MKKILLTTLLLVLVLIPFQAQAICEGPLVPCGLSEDSTSTTGIDESDPCTLCHLFALLDNILRFIITCLVPIVAVLMFTIGGVLFILSQFDIVSVDIFSKAKGTVTAVVVGLVIIFASWVFLNLFLSTIGVAEWTGLGSWWEIQCRPPTYCEECSDCSSGEYCEEARGICLALLACAECSTGYGFNPQEYNEDQRGDCSDCSTCSGSAVGPGSCTPVTDNTQHGDCDDLCEACQSGVCGNAQENTDPGDYCYPEPQYQNGEDPPNYYCQKKEKDGNCNSSGSCNNTYGAWYNINDGEACSGDYECVGNGNTYYSPYTCSSGTCTGARVDMGCCECSYCSSGQYCDATHLCTDLAVCEVCNTGFGYSNITDGTSCGTCHACVGGVCTGQTTSCNADLYGCSGNQTCINGSCEECCDECSDCSEDEYCDSSSETCISLPNNGVCYDCNSGYGYTVITGYNEDDDGLDYDGCGDKFWWLGEVCKGCLSGSCVNITPRGQKDTYGSNTCSLPHWACDGLGSCLISPLESSDCEAGRWHWEGIFYVLGTCNYTCSSLGYDFCVSSGALVCSGCWDWCSVWPCSMRNPWCECQSYEFP